MKVFNMRRIYMVSVILASLILAGCGSSGSDTENYGGETLSETRRGASPLIEYDTLYTANPAVGVYQYDVSEGDVIITTLTVPEDKDYDLFFYDVDGKRVAQAATSGAGIDETLEYTVEKSNRLYVVIHDGIGNADTDDAGGSYGLFSTKYVPYICAGSYGGLTLNATRMGASPLVDFGTLYTGNQALGVYHYNVSDGLEIEATLTVPEDKEYNLYFYDADGNRVALAQTSGNGTDESLEYTVDNFTTLYVVVYDCEGNEFSGNSGGDYGLTLSLEAEIEVPAEIELSETAEANGDNDSAGTAQTIVNHTVVSGSLAYGTDYDDFFILDVVAGDTYDISMTDPVGVVNNFNLYLFDTNAQFIDGQQSESVEDFDQIVYTIPNGMTQLIIYVGAYNGAGDYALTVTSE